MATVECAAIVDTERGKRQLMGSVVARWTGWEARALREAKRMSVRDFAAHLGVNDAAVSNWERRGADARLRYDTQRLLDTDLTQSGTEIADRFERILHHEKAGGAGSLAAPAAARTQLAARSSQRTAALLDTFAPGLTETTYLPDTVAFECLGQFLASPARAFVLAGRAGSGKTRLIQHLVQQWSDRADFQSHTCTTWPPSTDVAAEILRYASLTSGEDALLSLEHAVGSLTRPCVVLIDGIDSDERLLIVGRQVDSILRQANSQNLRFVLAVRTPPELDLSAFPVLAAATFSRPGTALEASYSTTAWTRAQARQVWEQQNRHDLVPFTALPESLQALATTPLYMQLLCSAGNSTDIDTDMHSMFHVIGHCVRTLLARGSHHTETAINSLAQLAWQLMPEAMPESLADTALGTGIPVLPDVGRAGVFLIEQTHDGGIRFSHDVFREYFLAIRIVDALTTRGRSTATVTGFNELADHATRSAAVRGVFDFVVCALATSAPNLIEMIALAPSTTVDIALPMLIETSAAQGLPVSTDVLRACTYRCTQPTARRLARALLATPDLAANLGDQHAQWVVQQLQVHGSPVWDDIARHIEQMLDIRISSRILGHLDLDHPAHAAFLARHIDLFATSNPSDDGLLERLLTHIDWRVRAGLAGALHGHRPLAHQHTNRIVERLVRDEDYKVRAALAHMVGSLPPKHRLEHLEVLLIDRNWHVRERALQSVLAAPHTPLPDPALVATIIATAASDKSWDGPPISTAKLLNRIRLLSGDHALPASPAIDDALFGLLREVQTGWIQLPPELEQSLVAQGESSTHWLTIQEARATRQRHMLQPAVVSVREHFRRRRGQRSLQVALDVHSLDRAIAITQAAVDAGADFVEVGDPLIKRSGVAAIAAIRHAVPEAAVVAEMMSADWGRDQVELAAEAGADIVLLIGPASVANVSAAVTAARRLGVTLVLDTPAAQLNPTWLRDMERTGIDGFVVTTNIDIGTGSNNPLASARTIRSCSQLPVAVSGGFSAADELTNSPDWDIAIIGRSIADAVAPTDLTDQLTSIVRKIHPKERP
ncbi:3-keto-L-gulonate-6-phosphate decarboxylase/DNA-binding transcriptional regulator YiaG [Nocardia sp. GAS34]|uniref:orotidine 5'-phosphate decarboxylase / HUMPS family protein n=1 Tax=unclassified Nocardia TaxID=2637762 RepID=UPI003D220A9F